MIQCAVYHYEYNRSYNSHHKLFINQQASHTDTVNTQSNLTSLLIKPNKKSSSSATELTGF